MRLRDGVEVLWRSRHEVQVGVDRRHCVLLQYVTQRQFAALARLARSPGLPEREARRHLRANLLAQLADADLLAPAEATGLSAALRRECNTYARAAIKLPGLEQRPNHRVGLVGVGSYLARVAETLAACGYGQVCLSAELAAAAPPIAGAPGLLQRPGTDWAVEQDFVVVAGRHVTAPWLTRALTAADVPHLLVITGERELLVGPLVVPGQSACARCTHLHATAADPDWPALATQLVGLPPSPIPAVATVRAVSLVTQAAVAWLDRRDPEYLGRQLVVPFDGTGASLREIAAHPECGCGAATDGLSPVSHLPVARARPPAPADAAS
ncbi:hypothetical protein [Buchananella hordeovulneris]|uniref:hypothetical protein n=1 Tax=Buchananella hordeovulneris TaxID=52770 RepID=UPI0026DB9A88|nr:hypothetical protein [Buchananella hordeovulneris]MDO5080879.1 hypothetical protein [Buchananella hordeovulneris]